MSKVINEKVKYYLDLPYTLIIERHDEEKPYFSARVMELEGCITTGDTIEDVTQEIKDAMREWLELNIRLGKTIPEPLKSKKYSGKIIVRMPPALHEALMFRASEQGVSLNQYLVTSLSHTLGFSQGTSLKKRISASRKMKAN